jgi:hypothetical protein
MVNQIWLQYNLEKIINKFGSKSDNSTSSIMALAAPKFYEEGKLTDAASAYEFLCDWQKAGEIWLESAKLHGNCWSCFIDSAICFTYAGLSKKAYDSWMMAAKQEELTGIFFNYYKSGLLSKGLFNELKEESQKIKW